MWAANTRLAITNAPHNTSGTKFSFLRLRRKMNFACFLFPPLPLCHTSYTKSKRERERESGANVVSKNSSRFICVLDPTFPKDFRAPPKSEPKSSENLGLPIYGTLSWLTQILTRISRAIFSKSRDLFPSSVSACSRIFSLIFGWGAHVPWTPRKIWSRQDEEKV